MNARNLWLIEGDPSLRTALATQLDQAGGWFVSRLSGATEALTKARSASVDIILISDVLEEGEPLALCRALRADHVSAPILYLSASDDDSVAIAALEAGASDVVAKPLRLGVLLARLHAHLRDNARAADQSLAIGPLEFRPASKILVKPDGAKIRLTDKETAILRHLHRARGGSVAREALLEEVWGYQANVATHTLETHIYRLRRKIEPDPKAARLLVTDEGGYRLMP